ncbi:multimeric flavodoxin WrbA [Parabacteroides sp. PF5-5]|uniref:flavodoxin family protein n=1 Tax=unclassified Parabacteroides TaxID=2649774 RepID=UPI002473EAD1|nr:MULTISPECIES: flavodoxin family protein [unclassified Parabacteroides]MDH6306540.1 multimeric flavodoxin WrbA [Parabacteroides sp. PH5-39]MDH6317507.1 multimeric flavodoxin WrbA [Parabacteroides sp. PF5-13]MDH6321190.1 multimeric flavodoxin WrbA [Parabacteroides sp. PH5-13]MDH6324922.1 multimeric flavodoxin WrbA [Parabacteroides sp. PH5-8]MDH6328631.1 multimeric flavodoxin WrbA [Parabacteroides sp. PH5-41]
MKVIAINGSPHAKGNTYLALAEVGVSLKEEGIDYEIIHVGHKQIHGCIGCGKCQEKRNGTCVAFNDVVNEVLPKLKEADAIVLGSPVYYAGIAGTMKCFLDRAFYVAGANGGWFRHKVGAAVVAVRRSGGTMTFNSLNHYFGLSDMLVPTSVYWNIIHGLIPGEASQDQEGIEVMNTIGKNIAWMLKMKEETKDKLTEPASFAKTFTNFIR